MRMALPGPPNINTVVPTNSAPRMRALFCIRYPFVSSCSLAAAMVRLGRVDSLHGDGSPAHRDPARHSGELGNRWSATATRRADRRGADDDPARWPAGDHHDAHPGPRLRVG